MLKQSLNIKTKHETRLEPAVILRSSLLELPLLRLEERIREEIEDNPLLESNDGIETAEKDDSEGQNSTDESEQDFMELVKTFSDYDDGYSVSPGDDEREFQQAYHRTLRDSLHEQAQEVLFGQTETEIAGYIIDNLDKDGFFTADFDLIRSEFPHTTDTTIRRILKVIQNLEPAGIASRNTRECLIVQLKARDLYLEDTYIVLRDHYDDLVNKRYSVIMKNTGISREQMQEVLDEIRTLNPKPGSSRVAELWEQEDDNMSITPDFIVREIDGRFEIILNNSTVPNLYINKKFEQIYLSKNPDARAKDYVRKKLESAKWFINAVDQRMSTMKKVMKSIVERQKEFFLYGRDRIKPMILKDVAEDIEMDIATVSRATKDKYVDTDFGVFELKYFFTERSHTAGGDDVSTRIVKEKIREIIRTEDKQKPFSDQTISDALSKMGYTAARRTVQKYREQMNFPPARLRKEL